MSEKEVQAVYLSATPETKFTQDLHFKELRIFLLLIPISPITGTGDKSYRHGQQTGPHCPLCDAVLDFCGHLRPKHYSSRKHDNSSRKHDNSSRKQHDNSSRKQHDNSSRKQHDNSSRKQHDNSSTKHDNSSTKHDNSSRKHDNSSRKHDNSSTKHDNSSRKRDNSSRKHDNSSRKHDNSSRKHDNSSTKHDNSSTKHDNSSTKHDNSSTKHDNSSTKHDNSSTKHDNSSTKHDISSTKHDNSSTKHDNTTTTPATTATTTTLAPPLISNTTVDNLVVLISRAGCGNTKLCLDQPSGCTPGAAAGCSFCSLSQTSGQNFVVELSGESDGYIALSVSFGATQGVNAQTYVCANANGVVRFFSTFLNNGVLSVTELNVNSVRGRVNGRNIQCIFAVTLPNSSNRAASLSAAVVNGTFNNATVAFGRAVSQIQTGVIDLANPSSNFTNLVTPSHGITLQQSLTQALLIAVGVLSLTRL
ncbi:uncharacterized protein LOC141761202 [Sebastes fasciatus]|uniref:uncharacterized protein LOC141761202 n=1 Tax=Sebastes fasciatus TaxID=394691 RepID=UPI003D9E3AAC